MAQEQEIQYDGCKYICYSKYVRVRSGKESLRAFCRRTDPKCRVVPTLKEKLIMSIADQARQYSTAEEFEKSLRKRYFKDTFGRDVIFIGDKQLHLDTADHKKWGLLHQVQVPHPITGEPSKILNWLYPPVATSPKEAIYGLLRSLGIKDIHHFWHVAKEK